MSPKQVVQKLPALLEPLLGVHWDGKIGVDPFAAMTDALKAAIDSLREPTETTSDSPTESAPQPSAMKSMFFVPARFEQSLPVMLTSASVARGASLASQQFGMHMRQSLLLNFAMQGWRRLTARLLAFVMRPRLSFLAYATLPSMPTMILAHDKLHVFAPPVAEPHLLLPSIEVVYDLLRYQTDGADGT